MTTPRKKIKHNGIMITYQQAADHFGLSYAVVVAMYGKGMTTIDEMTVYRDNIDKGLQHKGGRVAVIYETSNGPMSIPEIAKCHPFKLDVNTLRNRGDTWGFDHKCMWLDKIKGWGNFHKAAVDLDGPPRGATTTKTPYKTVPCQDKSAPREKKLPVNRLKCCLRDKGRERCRTYDLRLNQDDDIPEPCKAASGDYCKNYDGKQLKVHMDCSGRGVKHFGPSGTPMCLR